MVSHSVNIDNPLELIQKTYNLQTTTNNHENSSQQRSSVVRISSHHPSRKTSVHDLHQVTRDDLNKILGDIRDNLSRLKGLLETMTSVSMIRDEFFKIKNHLFNRINEFIQKLSRDAGKRGSIISKGNSSNLISNHPQYLVYYIEYFRSELVKAKYLFSSLTLSSAIGSSTLNNTTVIPFLNTNINQTEENNADLNEINKDINHLEEEAHILNQRYYSQIPDWHGLDDTIGGTMNIDGKNELHVHRLQTFPLTQNMSTRSSVTSTENTNFCSRLFQKCQITCCMCKQNYL